MFRTSCDSIDFYGDQRSIISGSHEDGDFDDAISTGTFNYQTSTYPEFQQLLRQHALAQNAKCNIRPLNSVNSASAGWLFSPEASCLELSVHSRISPRLKGGLEVISTPMFVAGLVLHLTSMAAWLLGIIISQGFLNQLLSPDKVLPWLDAIHAASTFLGILGPTRAAVRVVFAASSLNTRHSISQLWRYIPMIFTGLCVITHDVYMSMLSLQEAYNVADSPTGECWWVSMAWKFVLSLKYCGWAWFAYSIAHLALITAVPKSQSRSLILLRLVAVSLILFPVTGLISQPDVLTFVNVDMILSYCIGYMALAIVLPCQPLYYVLIYSYLGELLKQDENEEEEPVGLLSSQLQWQNLVLPFCNVDAELLLQCAFMGCFLTALELTSHLLLAEVTQLLIVSGLCVYCMWLLLYQFKYLRFNQPSNYFILVTSIYLGLRGLSLQIAWSNNDIMAYFAEAVTIAFTLLQALLLCLTTNLDDRNIIPSNVVIWFYMLNGVMVLNSVFDQSLLLQRFSGSENQSNDRTWQSRTFLSLFWAELAYYFEVLAILPEPRSTDHHTSTASPTTPPGYPNTLMEESTDTDPNCGLESPWGHPHVGSTPTSPSPKWALSPHLLVGSIMTFTALLAWLVSMNPLQGVVHHFFGMADHKDDSDSMLIGNVITNALLSLTIAFPCRIAFNKICNSASVQRRDYFSTTNLWAHYVPLLTALCSWVWYSLLMIIDLKSLLSLWSSGRFWLIASLTGNIIEAIAWLYCSWHCLRICMFLSYADSESDRDSVHLLQILFGTRIFVITIRPLLHPGLISQLIEICREAPVVTGALGVIVPGSTIFYTICAASIRNSSDETKPMPESLLIIPLRQVDSHLLLWMLRTLALFGGIEIAAYNQDSGFGVAFMLGIILTLSATVHCIQLLIGCVDRHFPLSLTNITLFGCGSITVLSHITYAMWAHEIMTAAHLWDTFSQLRVACTVTIVAFILFQTFLLACRTQYLPQAGHSMFILLSGNVALLMGFILQCHYIIQICVTTHTMTWHLQVFFAFAWIVASYHLLAIKLILEHKLCVTQVVDIEQYIVT